MGGRGRKSGVEGGRQVRCGLGGGDVGGAGVFLVQEQVLRY